MSRTFALRFALLALPVFLAASLVPVTPVASAQDAGDATTQPADIGHWLPAAASDPMNWRDDLPGAAGGVSRVGLVIGFNRFRDERWAIPGSRSTLGEVARSFAQRLHLHPVVSQLGELAATWRVRDALRGLRAHFTEPGGTLLIYLQARAWRDTDGHLQLLTTITAATDGGYSDPLALADLAEWIADFRSKLGPNAPRVGIILELHADPLGTGMGDRDGDANADALQSLHRLWLAGPNATCAENIRAGITGGARAVADAIAAAATDQSVHLHELLPAITASLQPRLAPTLQAPENETLELQAETMRVVVHAVDARTGEPIDGATLACAGHRGAAPLTLTGLRETAVTLQASAPGYLPVSIPWTPQRAQDGQRVDVALLPEFGLVRVWLRCPDGSRASGRRVTLGAGADGLEEVIGITGIHRRSAVTDDAGMAWLPVPVAVLDQPLRVVVDAQETVWQPDAATKGTCQLRGATVATRRFEVLEVAGADRIDTRFRGLGAFAWQQALDAATTLPLRDLPVAIAGFRAALDEADDGPTRELVRATLRRNGLWFLRYARRHVDDQPALLRSASRVADVLVEQFATDEDVLAEKQFFEFATLPPDLKRRITQAITLASAREYARALPLLRDLVADARLPVAFRGRCETLLAEAARAVVLDSVAKARELYANGRHLEALAAIERAEPLHANLELVGALRDQILTALAVTNRSAGLALPVRPERFGGDRGNFAALLRNQLDPVAPARWFRLELSAPATVRLQLFSTAEQRPTPLRLTVTRDSAIGRDDTSGVSAVIRSAERDGDAREPAVYTFAAGHYLLRVTRDDAMSVTGPHPFSLSVRVRTENVATPASDVDPWVRVAHPLIGHSTRERALPVLPGEYRNQHIENGAEQWYRLTVSQPVRIRLGLRFTHTDGDLDIVLHRPDGSPLASSESADDNEEINADTTAGEYLIRIVNTGPDAADYALAVEVQQPAAGSSQGFTPDTALPLDGKAVVADVRAFQPRWYSFTLEQSARVQVQCQFRHADGDIDLAIYDRRTMRELQLAAGATDTEVLQLPLQSGDYFVKVWNGTDGSAVRFVLVMTQVPTGPETGGTPTEARPLPTDAPADVTVEPAAPIWFRLDLDDMAQVRIAAMFDVRAGDIGLALFRHHADAPLVEEDSRQAPERLDLTLPRGIYLLKVFNTRADAVTRVTLTASINPLVGNHTANTAIPIRPGLISGLPVDARERWFAVEIERPTAADGTPGRLLVIANPTSGGRVQVAVSTPDGTRVASSARPDGDFVFVPTDAAGQYLLQVVNQTPRTPIELTLDITWSARADLRSFATPLALPGPGEDATSELVTIDGRNGWRLLHVPRRLHVELEAKFVHVDGDVDLRLWRDRRQIAWAESTTDNEELALDLDPGVYVLQLVNAGNTDQRRMVIGVATTEPRTPGIGANTTPAAALPLSPREAIAGRGGSLQTMWYAFDNPDEQIVRIDAVFPAGAELTLTLRQDERVIAVGQTLRDAAWIEARLPAGAYRVTVSSASDQPCDYALMLTTGPEVGTGNDNARPFGPGTHAQADGLAGGSEHVYLVPVLRPSRVRVGCRFRHAQGDIDIRLTRLDDREMMSSADTQDSEEMSGTVPTGLYALHVRNTTNGGANPYTLELSMEADDAGPDAGRAGWPNISRGLAMPVQPGTPLTGRSGNGNDAWYRLTCTGDVLVTISIAFRHALGDLDMELRGPGNDTPVAESSSESDQEVIRRVCTAGDWDLRIFNYSGGEPNEFRLTVTVTELGAGASRASAIAISPDAETGRFKVDGKLATGGLPVWFALETASDARFDIELQTNPAAGDLDMAVFLGDSGEPASSTGGRGGRESIHRGVPGGKIFVRIHPAGGEGGPELPFTLEGRVQLYGDAIDREHAVPVTAGALRAQTAKPGVARWMILDLSEPTRVFLIATFSTASAPAVRIESGSGPVAVATGIAGMIHLRETLPAGRYFLVVDGSPINEAITYDLNLELTSPSVDTGRGAARVVKPGVRMAGASSPEKPAWLCLIVPRAMRVDLFVDFQHALGDIDVRLYRGEELLDEANGTENGERIARMLEPGIYFIEIHNVDSGSSNQWRLRLDAAGNIDKEFR